MKSHKCVVVGESNTGKTSLLMSYTTNTFTSEYNPTLFDEYLTTVQNKETMDTYQVNLWDTPGDDQHGHLRPLTYPQTDVFLACFPANDLRAFNNIKFQWIPELRNYIKNVETLETIPILLVATKSDQSYEITGNGYESDDDSMVLDTLTKELVASQRLMGFVRCSAKTNDGVKDVFNEVAKYFSSKETEISKNNSREQYSFYEKSSNDMVSNQNVVHVRSEPLDSKEDVPERIEKVKASTPVKSVRSKASRPNSSNRQYSKELSEKKLAKIKKWERKKGCICVIL
ncbi:hypothetical protein RNJ44_02331 [Nakaseomyces bracarensis]|uniref:Uncharacterized protein n=1 Tax=Nakaseomyces bracarensis TaxID=273131 RepID=A0ABR4NNA1_9SACH